MDGFLVGRLLMRFWALKTFQASNEVVIFDRSDRGRPRLLLNNDAKTWTFNVSHAGDYTVFVAQSKYRAGAFISRGLYIFYPLFHYIVEQLVYVLKKEILQSGP